MSKSGTVDEGKRHHIIVANEDAASPVLADLLRAGFKVNTISDLYNQQFNYKGAITLLLDWLPRIQNFAVKEEIVRAISVPWAKGTDAPKLLVEEFRNQISNPGLQWAIGNALSVVAENEIKDDIIGLIRNQEYGKAREMLVVSLSNMRASDVEPFLLELLDNEDLAGYAIIALGRIKSKSARQYIERFLVHPKSWVRKEAQKALKRIDK